MSIPSTEQRYTFEVFPRRGLTIVRGRVRCSTDKAGRALHHCVAGVGKSRSVGNANPISARRHRSEAGADPDHLSGIFYNDIRAGCWKRLGVDHAVERLRRVPVQLRHRGHEPPSARDARHGPAPVRLRDARGSTRRTMGALPATHKHRNAFEPLLRGFDFVPFNNVDKLRAAVGDDTAAVIVEIVQGEGGVRLGAAAYFAAARELCDTHGALLVVDEVQTGFCRTGRFFACEHHGVEPDIMCLAKAMAGGVPMGAVVVGERGAGRKWQCTLHLRRQPAAWAGIAGDHRVTR